MTNVKTLSLGFLAALLVTGLLGCSGKGKQSSSASSSESAAVSSSSSDQLAEKQKEIDALRTMNINPIHYLVLPRLVAIASALPLLVIFSVLVGWLGGAFVSVANKRIDIAFVSFFSTLRDVVEIKDVANGVFKSFIFALVIGVVSCHQGLITRGGPRGIGRSVTKAVVNSIILIVILDYILTRVLLK